MRTDRTLARPKRTTEEFRIAWDFVDDLTTGDTITVARSVTATKVSDGSDASSTFLETVSLTGSVLSVQVQAGADGQDYAVKFIAPTTNGDRFERVVLVQVRD